MSTEIVVFKEPQPISVVTQILRGEKGSDGEGGVKTSKGTTTYYVNADTGNDSNNGTASIAPFATIAKAIAELEKWAWTATPVLNISGATLLASNISIKGKFIHDQNLNITIGSTTSRASGTITINNFDTLRLRVYGVGAFNCTTQYVNTIASDSIFNLTNLSSSNVNVLGFSNINSMYLDRSSNFVFSGTLNVTTLFIMNRVREGYLHVHSLANFTTPRTVANLFIIIGCDIVSIAHTGASFVGIIYTLDYSTLNVSDLLGSDALVGTAPNTFYPDINTSYIFDLTTNKPYNYDNTSSELLAVNYQEAIDELDTKLDALTAKTIIGIGQTIEFFVDPNNGNDLNDGLTDLTPKATLEGLSTTLETYKLEGGSIGIYLMPNPTGNVYTVLNLSDIATVWSGEVELATFDGVNGLGAINIGSEYQLFVVQNCPDLEVIARGLTVVSTSNFSNATVFFDNVRKARVSECFLASGVAINKCPSVTVQSNTLCQSISSSLSLSGSSNAVITNNILANRGTISISDGTRFSISNVTRQSTVNTQADYLFSLRNATNVLITGTLALQGDRGARWFFISNSQVVISLASITYTSPTAAVASSATIPFIDIRNSDVKFRLTNASTHVTTGTFIRATLDTISKTIFVVNNVLDYTFNFVAGATGGGTFTVPAGADFNGLGYRNNVSGLLATTYQDAIDEIKTLTASINVQTVNADLQLQNNSARVQDLTNPSSTQRQILLPTTPIQGKEFVFINSEASVGNFLINGSVVLPGDRYALIWNGNLWREL